MVVVVVVVGKVLRRTEKALWEMILGESCGVSCRLFCVDLDQSVGFQIGRRWSGKIISTRHEVPGMCIAGGGSDSRFHGHSWMDMLEMGFFRSYVQVYEWEVDCYTILGGKVFVRRVDSC